MLLTPKRLSFTCVKEVPPTSVRVGEVQRADAARACGGSRYGVAQPAVTRLARVSALGLPSVLHSQSALPTWSQRVFGR